LRLLLPVVSADDTGGQPLDRAEQRLSVVLEPADIPDQTVAVPVEAAAVDVHLDILPQLEILVDDPVDHLACDLLDLVGRIADHPMLELAPHRVAVHERPDPADADGLLEERIATTFHLEHERIDLAEA